MAKVVLVAENLNPTVRRLINGLCNQMHAVTLITSKDETDFPDRINVMQPFKKWSAFEAIRIVPLLYAMNPQIIHVILNDSHIRGAHVMLASVAKILPHTVLSTSLLHLGQGLRRRNPTRYLLQESDIVTCPSVETLGALRGLNIRPSRQGRGILPPMMNLSADDSSIEKSQVVTELLARMKNRPYLAVPFMEPGFDSSRMAFRRIAMMAAHRHLLLMGSTADWSLRERKRFQAWMARKGLDTQWTFTGHLNAPDIRRVLGGAEAFVLAGQNLTPFETTEYYLTALQAGTTLVLDDRQSTIHAHLWRHKENAWIFPLHDLLKQLQTQLTAGSLHLESVAPESLNLHRDLIDTPLNELNRLYNRALAVKHS